MYEIQEITITNNFLPEGYYSVENISTQVKSVVKVTVYEEAFYAGLEKLKKNKFYNEQGEIDGPIFNTTFTVVKKIDL